MEKAANAALVQKKSAQQTVRANPREVALLPAIMPRLNTTVLLSRAGWAK
jgi:hypothetical protein